MKDFFKYNVAELTFTAQYINFKQNVGGSKQCSRLLELDIQTPGKSWPQRFTVQFVKYSWWQSGFIRLYV